MKRIAFFAFLLLVSVSVLGNSRLSVSPAEMKDGETKTLVDGDKTITVKKSGNSIDVKVEGAGETRTISITNSGGDIVIGRDGFRFDTLDHMNIKPPKIVFDRSEIERRMPHAQAIFVCPKDHTVLRVPEDKAGNTYKCPVDGTTMEKRKGHGMMLFDFDREESESGR